MDLPRRTQQDRSIVPVLSYILSQMVAKNDKLPMSPDKMTIFHAGAPPSISIQSYLERMMKYAPCSTECFIVGLVYIDRIIQQNHDFLITSLNVHRLLITGVMLAAKFFDDCYFNNAYSAKVGGVPCVEMNILELEFLFLIRFSLNVGPDIFESYRHELMKHSLRINGPQITKPVTEFEDAQLRNIIAHFAHQDGSALSPSASQIKQACEQLVGDEVKKKSLSPSLITRTSELLHNEERDCAGAMSPSAIGRVAWSLVQEHTALLSPGLLRKASLLQAFFQRPLQVSAD